MRQLSSQTQGSVRYLTSTGLWQAGITCQLPLTASTTTRSALTKSSPGWCPTGCSLTLPRLRCSGVHLLDVSIRSRLVLLVLVTHLCCRYEQFETWGSILTQTSPWVLTSLCVLQHSVKFAVCRLLTRRPTTLLTLVHAPAAQFSRVFPDNCYNSCSLQRRRSSRVLSEEVRAHKLHSSVNYTGWKFQKEFSSSYAFSCSVALMARRYHSSLRPSTWLSTNT